MVTIINSFRAGINYRAIVYGVYYNTHTENLFVYYYSFFIAPIKMILARRV